MALVFWMLKVFHIINSMAIKHFDMKKRVCIYIDGANFYGGLTSINRRFTDTKFDFEKYIKFLTSKDELVHINYYNALVKKKVNERVWEKQINMLNRMRKIKKCRVTLCTRKSRLNILGEEFHTIKGDDLSLALDAIEDCYVKVSLENHILFRMW